MEIVEDDTPHAQNKLKDVASEEVEDMHAHDTNGFDDDMEICNLDDIEFMEERGGVLKYL